MPGVPLILLHQSYPVLVTVQSQLLDLSRWPLFPIELRYEELFRGVGVRQSQAFFLGIRRSLTQMAPCLLRENELPKRQHPCPHHLGKQFRLLRR